MPKNIKKLDTMTTLMKELVLREDFEVLIKKILNFVEAIKKGNQASQVKFETFYNRKIKEFGDSNNTKLSQVEKEFKGIINKALKDQESGLNFIRDKVRELQDGIDGTDGKDADEEKIIKTVLGQIKLPEEKVLEIEDIDGLKEELEKIREAKRLGGGGGFNKIALDIHFIDNESVGTGDGTTTEFTLDYNPSPSASLRIIVGGGELFLTDDWTISEKTITFLTAPPNGAKIRANYRK